MDDLWINDLNEKIVLSFMWQMSLKTLFSLQVQVAWSASKVMSFYILSGYTGGCIQKGSLFKHQWRLSTVGLLTREEIGRDWEMREGTDGRITRSLSGCWGLQSFFLISVCLQLCSKFVRQRKYFDRYDIIWYDTLIQMVFTAFIVNEAKGIFVHSAVIPK